MSGADDGLNMTGSLHFEAAMGKKVILSSEYEHGFEIASHYQEAAVRPSDSPMLVHSTLLSTYGKIMNDGCLKSVTRLRKERFSVHPIGLAPLGEPLDYLDYVMFADGGLAPEFVISARLTGSITCNPDEPYAPQARMYFDGYRLVKDGLITRCLGSKVHDHVPLDKYLLGVATVDNIALPEGRTAWTPFLFSSAADTWAAKMFYRNSANS